MRPLRVLITLVAISVLSFFFANVEIQIEGPSGWASSLPVTFRVSDHWALDWFWGSRPMTGYHAWVFAFMALAFHVPCILAWQWNARMEARIIGSVMLFWIIEDALWFVCNPAYGWAGLRPGADGAPGLAWWHRHWALGLPTDYLTFSTIGLVALWWGSGTPSTPNQKPSTTDQTTAASA